MKGSPNFPLILAADCETSGLNNATLDPSEGYQMVSLGLIVADTEYFKPIDEFYIEIQWNGESIWSPEAERIHGMSKKYLEKHGVPEETAVEEISLFIDKHFGMEKAISCLGQNVARFDVPFMRNLLHKYGVPFKFAHRHVDTFSLSMPTVGAYSSDQLFEIMGFGQRATHNSLEDARMALKSVSIIRKMWKAAYE